MSQLPSQLYDIFRSVFQLLKSSLPPESRAQVCAEVVRFFGLLTSQKVEPSLQHSDASRDFFCWLALQIFGLTLNKDLQDVSSLIADQFSQVLELHAPHDPLILSELLDHLIESIGQSLDNSGSYYQHFDEPVFNVKCANAEVVDDNDDKVISLSNSDEIEPAFLFFLTIVERCLNVITQMDQTYSIHILNLLNKMYDRCSDILKEKALVLIPKLVITTMPSNFWEWDAVYGSLDVFGRRFVSSGLSSDQLESMFVVVGHAVRRDCDARTAELCFVQSLEVAFASLQEDSDVSRWVQLAVDVMDRVDWSVFEFDSIVSKLVGSYDSEFLPVVGKYLVGEVGRLLGSGAATTEKFVVHQHCPAWQYCLTLLERVSAIAYSSESFEKVLSCSGKILTTGSRLAQVLEQAHARRFELVQPQALRPISSLPYLCHECLSDFSPTKYEALVHYAAAICYCFPDLKNKCFDDSLLIDHIFILFAIPWTKKSSHQAIPLKVKLACLTGLLNLIYVLPPDKSLKYVSALRSTFHDKITASGDDVLIKKILSVLILILYRVPQNITNEIINVLKTHLVPEKVAALLFNEFLGHKLLCFLSNRGCVERGPEFWELRCTDCDNIPATRTTSFDLPKIVEQIALSFLTGAHTDRGLTNCYSNGLNHCARLKSPAIVQAVLNLSLQETLDDELVAALLNRLSISDEQPDDATVIAIWQTLCSNMRNYPNQPYGLKEKRLLSLLQMTKKLLLLTTPSELLIFKFLMVYFLSSWIGVSAIRSLFNTVLTSRKSDFNAFCRTYEPELAQFVVDFMLRRHHVANVSPSSSFTEVMTVLGYKIDSVLCETNFISSVLVEMIKTCEVDETTLILTELATLFALDLKSFLETHYENIFSYIYALDDGKVFTNKLVPLFDSCGLGLEKSLHWKYSQLVCKLILNSNHPLKIFRFLFHSQYRSGTEDVSLQLDELKQHFVGCLTVIESSLNCSPSTISLRSAENYIRTIANFVKILGMRSISSIQVKLLTTLRVCLPAYYDSLPEPCLVAWVHYCYSVDVAMIGPYLSTILIHVLPLFDKFPDMVASICHYFVVENGQHFRDQLPQLYFIPCHPHVKMQQVWCVVQTSLLLKGKFNRDLLCSLENIYSDSTETKILALEYLRWRLRERFSDRTNNETLDPSYEMILTCLLDNVAHKNDDVKTLCGACLGELGAIDPMKFGFNDVHKSYTPMKYNLSGDDFSVLCITKLVHCLGKSDDSGATGIIYSTIQELLRLQLLGKSDSYRGKYFTKFSTQDQYVLLPLLQTKYIFKAMKIDRHTGSQVTFGLHTVKTPCEWATHWAAQMLARMPGSLSKNVFSTCLPSMKINMEVTETVLPYILLYALLTCDPGDVDLIEQEMKAILQWDLSKYRTKLDNRMLVFGESRESVIHSDVSQTKYVALILDLLDFINQAVSDCYFAQATLGIPNEDKLESKIKDFVDRFPPSAMSWKSFTQKDHYRALYYIEKSSTDNSTKLKPLRNIYSKLNDIDGLIGVAKSSSSAPSTEETVVNHIVSGAIQDVISGYERLCSKYDSTNTYRGLIQCYVNVNQASTALAVSSQIINSDKYLKPDIFSEHIEALWGSEHYKETDDIFEELGSSFLSGRSWSVDLVGIFRLLSKPKYNDVIDKIKSTRLAVVNKLCDLNRSGMNLYRQGYWYMVKLHILNDIESFTQILFSIPPKGGKYDNFRDALNYSNRRLSLLPTRGSYLQDVRKCHVQTLDIVFSASKHKLDSTEELHLSSHLGMIWLDSAKMARKKRCLQDAYTCIGIAEKYNPPKLFIELAKYYQAKFDTDGAVRVLQHGLNQTSASSDSNEARRIFAKAKLLTASFNVSSMNLDFNDGYTAFKEAAEICNLEKSFVCLATYLYHQHLTEPEPDNTVAKRFIQLDSARNFSKSLLYGTKHIYQSMPCMLGLWLDYGARIATKLGGSKKADETGMMKTLKDFNSLMENNLLCLPTYMFMTAFSQILSRINHRQSSCFDILKLIIAQILQDYHQQAMWSFTSVCRTSNTMQKTRTEEICKRIKTNSRSLSQFFKVFNEFTDKLIEISMKKLKYSKVVKLSQVNSQLKPLIESFRQVPIMLPLQRLLTVHISSCRTEEAAPQQHTPFPLAPVYVTDVKDQVMMLFSVQMPKRLEFVGSDGVVYPIMCKKDDLRLDSRIMEFNSVINSQLRMDSAAEEKNLSIRTYSVVPLNSECGIIEWLSGLLSLKSIIGDMYSKLGIPAMPMSQIKKLMLVSKDEVDMSERLRRFEKVILPQHPPVLHQWFFERHPSPDAWYHCRNAFVKSAAVMSIVGYIVGLGDRHGENILIDSASGEAVHVDFNCLFNKSDLLTYPETVPFRLTHSMVRAMGATEVEGLFVVACETTNRVMRHNSEQLLSIMKPFLYDIDVKPLFNPRKSSHKDSTADDQANDEAKINIHNIELRLSGVVRCKTDQFAPHRNSKPLSVEGQTRMLIKEATSNLNLCQMFAGWGPYY